MTEMPTRTSDQPPTEPTSQSTREAHHRKQDDATDPRAPTERKQVPGRNGGCKTPHRENDEVPINIVCSLGSEPIDNCHQVEEFVFQDVLRECSICGSLVRSL